MDSGPTSSSGLRETAGKFVNAAKSHGGLAQLRRSLAATNGFWWTLDELHATQTRRTLFQWLRRAGATVALGIAVWVLVTHVFPVNPNTLLLSNIVDDMEKVVTLQDWDAARDAAQAGLETSNNATEVLLWATVIEERLGNRDQAVQFLDEALSDRNIPQTASG